MICVRKIGSHFTFTTKGVSPQFSLTWNLWFMAGLILAVHGFVECEFCRSFLLVSHIVPIDQSTHQSGNDWGSIQWPIPGSARLIIPQGSPLKFLRGLHSLCCLPLPYPGPLSDWGGNSECTQKLLRTVGQLVSTSCSWLSLKSAVTN